ncbi:MAG: hypothetical protein HYX63_03310 [Gammaproteobacteria bacterium]|nr:hypothetical protein [Gammaproteobacteria bacterium]
MTGGWQSQFERMCRWHDRLDGARPGDKIDFLYAFFENAFHLRDWLIDTGAVKSADVDHLFAESEVMRLCRDIANAHKHYSLMRPSQPMPFTELREYQPYGGGNLTDSQSLSVLSDGEKYDAFDLASRVRCAWEGFLKQAGLHE